MSQPTRILLALIAGLLLGLAAAGWVYRDQAVSIAEPIGGLWLTALQMTIVPLVVSLLVTGRALIFFLIILWLSSGFAALFTPFLLNLWPLDPAAADALRGALAGAEQVSEVPTFADFLRSILPSNPISAAANDAILPLILFTLVFAFALTRLPQAPRDTLVGFFRAIADTMLVMVNWVLWLAPIGVLALAFAVGAKAGAAAFGALVHYVIIVSAVGIVIWMVAVPIGIIGGRVPLGRYLRAIGPSQAVALSTQSSLASLPAMLRGAQAMRIPVAASGVILPLAVAIFRATGPAMNLAVAIYIAHWFGIELTPMQMAAGIAVAATTTLGAVSLPGQVSFVTSIAPICVAMGLPIAPLAILIAVEMIPDIFRTLGNVTMDLSATATVARRGGFVAEAEVAGEEDRLLREGA
jgi:proton glutamate symport protein